MNERIKELMLLAGCWDELDDYAQESIGSFAEVIVRECCNIVSDEVPPAYDFDNQHPVIARMKEHFGVE